MGKTSRKIKRQQQQQSLHLSDTLLVFSHFFFLLNENSLLQFFYLIKASNMKLFFLCLLGIYFALLGDVTDEFWFTTNVLLQTNIDAMRNMANKRKRRRKYQTKRRRRKSKKMQIISKYLSRNSQLTSTCAARHQISIFIVRIQKEKNTSQWFYNKQQQQTKRIKKKAREGRFHSQSVERKKMRNDYILLNLLPLQIPETCVCVCGISLLRWIWQMEIMFQDIQHTQLHQ